MRKEPKERKNVKRRVIRSWYQQHICRDGFECTKCETLIVPYTLYERSVIARGNHLEVERIHAKPDCPDHYIMA